MCGPLADRVFREGQASFQDDVRLFMRRPDYTEEVFYSFSYSPIRDESGGVGGLFCPSAETTGQVLGARRLATLSALAAEALVKSTVAEACDTAMAIIGANPDDVPFSLLFLADEAGALRLAAGSNLGIERTVTEDPARWCADQAFARGTAGLPIGLADQPVRRLRVVPVSRAAGERPYGVLVAAASPARPLDREYLAFFDLVASQRAPARDAGAGCATGAGCTGW